MAQEPGPADRTAARIVEIGEDSHRVSFLGGDIAIVTEGGTERIPIREIAGMVSSLPGLAWSGPALAALTENSVGIVLCGSNHRSSTMTWPMSGRRWPRRIRAQLQIDPAFGRHLQKLLAKAGLAQQVLALQAMGKGGAYRAQIRAQRSGNALRPWRRKRKGAEDILKRHYWPWLVGTGFRRDPRKPGANAVINYGYTALRVAATRAVHAAGLLPTIGLRGRAGEDGLVDEFMVPFKPAVDLAAAIFIATGHDRVDARLRDAFTRLLETPLRGSRGPTQIALALHELAYSLGDCLDGNAAGLELHLPARQDPDTLYALIAADG